MYPQLEKIDRVIIEHKLDESEAVCDKYGINLNNKVGTTQNSNLI
ncbi:hypothetical protein [Clostridium sp. AWRP]|nr:hypothetical protein [Clostridium sp. AWRP]